MPDVTTMRCSLCERHFSPLEVSSTCPVCGEVGTLDVLYDYAHLKATYDRDALSASRESSLWRYKSLLPVDPDGQVPPLFVGGTPLYHAPRLAMEFGLPQVWVKDDSRNPTGSLKDRASTVIVARALQANIPVVATASTGNAAAALAGVSASVEGIRAVIFVPASAPEAKIAQLLVYGADVVLIEDSYDVAFDLCTQVCTEQGWYNRSTGINPYTAEGKKTVAYEIAEGLGWTVPDVVMVSVGDGNILAGIHKGFYDLYELGWIQRIPRLIGVQAIGSSPLYQAWKAGTQAEDMRSVDVHTIADSISAGLPRDRAKALRAVRQTQGAFVTVSDDEIIAAIPPLARFTGVFAEPAASAVYAGAKRALELGYIEPAETVVLVITGSGLKDIRRAQQSVGEARRAAPTLSAVRRALGLT